METQEQKFTQIVEEYKRTIYTVCYMFSKDEDEVNDLFQEILIRLWQGYRSRGLIQDRVDISLRPSVVDEKKRFGDFEIDTMIGRNHKAGQHGNRSAATL